MPFRRVRPWRERPPLRDAWYGIGEGRHGHAHATLSGGVAPGPTIPDCLGKFHNTRDVNHLHIQKLCSPPHFIRRFESAVQGPSWT